MKQCNINAEEAELLAGFCARAIDALRYNGRGDEDLDKKLRDARDRLEVSEDVLSSIIKECGSFSGKMDIIEDDAAVADIISRIIDGTIEENELQQMRDDTAQPIDGNDIEGFGEF
ncbi:hypothetical protein TomMM35A_20060 [Sphingobium sp. TomMM35A]